MFPMAAALMHHALEQAAATIRATATPCWSGDRALVLPRARRPEQRLRRPPRGAGVAPRRPGGGDDVQPAGVRGRRPRHQQGRRGRRAAQPGVEGGRGRPRARSSPARSTPWPTGRPSRCWPSCWATAGSPTSTTGRRPDAGGRPSPGTGRPRRAARPTRRCWSSARARPGCPRRSATPTGRWAAPPPTGARPSASARTTGSRWPRRPSHILGLLNLLAAASAGATVRLHRRFDLDEVLRRIEAERMTLEMAVAPIALAMANHPDLEDFDLSSLRYIMWGATPVSEQRGRGWSPSGPACAGSRPTGPARCRSSPSTRSTTRTPGGSTRPGCRPPGVELRVADLDTGAVLAPGRDR